MDDQYSSIVRAALNPRVMSGQEKVNGVTVGGRDLAGRGGGASSVRTEGLRLLLTMRCNFCHGDFRISRLCFAVFIDLLPSSVCMCARVCELGFSRKVQHNPFLKS